MISPWDYCVICVFDVWFFWYNQKFKTILKYHNFHLKKHQNFHLTKYQKSSKYFSAETVREIVKFNGIPIIIQALSVCGPKSLKGAVGTMAGIARYIYLTGRKNDLKKSKNYFFQKLFSVRKNIQDIKISTSSGGQMKAKKYLKLFIWQAKKAAMWRAHRCIWCHYASRKFFQNFLFWTFNRMILLVSRGNI